MLDGKGSTQQLTVRARYSDGTDRDVTNLAVFLTNNDVSAPVSPDGLVTAGARGEAFVMARFETHTVGTPFIVLPKGLNFTFPSNEPETNYIDKLVNEKLKKLRIAPSGQCDDETFLRRVSLDIVGLPPTSEEFDRFMKSTDPAKRSKWIDELLERKEFSEIWVSKWAELLQVRTDYTRNVSPKGMFLYYNWLVDKLSKNMPMDEMVQELLVRQRWNVQERSDQLLSDHERDPAAHRECGPGVHGDSRAVCAVPQSSVRPLDAERLLQFCRLLCPDRPQAGRRLSRNNRFQLGRRRGQSPGRRAGDAAQVSGRRSS